MTLGEHKNIISRNLLHYRVEKKFTQEKLAEMADISSTHYAALETCRKDMSAFVLKKIAEALEVSSDALLSVPSEAKQVSNINLLLTGKSPEFIYSVEKTVRFIVSEFSGDEYKRE